MPFLPTSPTTCPFLTVGMRKSLNEFSPYWWIFSVLSSSLKFRMSMASKGQTLMQIPHPMQSSSDIFANLSSPKIMHSCPLMFTGHSLMHSRPHFFVWHRSRSTTATLWTESFSLLREPLGDRAEGTDRWVSRKMEAFHTVPGPHRTPDGGF